MKYAIDEIFYFRKLLFIRGWCFSDPGDEICVSLVLPTGGSISVPYKRLASPDVEKVWGENAANCRFDTHVAVPETVTYEDLLLSKVLFESSSGQAASEMSPWKRRLRVDPFWNQQNLIKAVADYRGIETVPRPDENLDPVSDSSEIFALAMEPLSGGRVLELGSRARSGIVRRHLFGDSEYTGFDVKPGDNVDVVGDAHRLAEYFPPNTFDLVISISVFEHLSTPLQVVLQINHVMKENGLLIINTHQSWPVHDAPWDYHRFSEYTWPQLFNPSTGFEVVEAVMGEPCYVVPATLAPHYEGLDLQKGYLASRCIARKTGKPKIALELDIEALRTTQYPA